MMLLKILIISFLITIALGLLFATRVGRKRPPTADPYFHPFGDMPGFSREQLEAIARRPVEQHHEVTLSVTANPEGQGSGAVFRLPHGAAVDHGRLRHVR